MKCAFEIFFRYPPAIVGDGKLLFTNFQMTPHTIITITFRSFLPTGSPHCPIDTVVDQIQDCVVQLNIPRQHIDEKALRR